MYSVSPFVSYIINFEVLTFAFTRYYTCKNNRSLTSIKICDCRLSVKFHVNNIINKSRTSGSK